jgi:hypothetical protein
LIIEEKKNYIEYTNLSEKYRQKIIDYDMMMKNKYPVKRVNIAE